MRVIVITLSGLLALLANAGSVLWNGLEGDSWKNTLGVFNYDVDAAYTTIYFYSEVATSGFYIAPEQHACEMEWAGCVVRAVAGERIEENTVRGRSDGYFLRSKLDGLKTGSDYGIFVDGDSTFYLMFATGTYLETDNPYYGWAEIYVAENGYLSLKRSAIGLDHQAMIVGGGEAIPEPNSAILLLLGLSGLALRRRRVS